MNNQNELKHYGVLGMKWGVRRARNTLNSSESSTESKQKAVNSLQKHKTKINKKLTSLDKQRTKLQNRRDSQIKNTDLVSARLMGRAADLRSKKYGLFTSQSKADRLEYQAGKLEAKAQRMMSRTQATKARIERNEYYKTVFNQGLNEIDSLLVEKGKKYLNA